MKALTKRNVLYTALFVLILTLTGLTYFIKRMGDQDQNRHVAVRVLRSMVDLKYRLHETVLQAHAFRLENYDSLVSASTGIQDFCPSIFSMKEEFLVDYGAGIEDAMTEYCDQVARVLPAVEEFKSKNSLLKNSIHYFPLLIANLQNTQVKHEAADLYSKILLYCLQPGPAKFAEIQNRLQMLGRTIARDPSHSQALVTLRQHAGLVVKTAADRESIEARIYSPQLEAAEKELTDAYLMNTDRLETRSKYFKTSAVVFSALLVILLLIAFYRLQLAADSLGEMNANLEHRVESRTQELRNALSDLERQQQVLAQSAKMSALGEMAGGIAHEVNTPLAAIMLKAESLLMLEENSENGEKGLNEIITIVSKIAKIVSGLKRFARSNEEEAMAPVPVSQIVEDTLVLCSQKFLSHGIEVKIDVNPLHVIRCVPEQVSQVLLNLLNNSYDAILQNPERWVSVQTQKSDSEIVIRVADSGPGIPPEVQKKLMQPFFTTKAVGQGTGIGLSISRNIIQKHGGSLVYDSASPNTAFEIRLPRVGISQSSSAA